MVGTGDRSAKIRTYNFPQSRVTDHRINLSVHNLRDVLDGDLDDLVDALRMASRRSRRVPERLPVAGAPAGGGPDSSPLPGACEPPAGGDVASGPTSRERGGQMILDGRVDPAAAARFTTRSAARRRRAAAHMWSGRTGFRHARPPRSTGGR